MPIPSSLRGNESGTWAEYSVATRLPEIGRRAVKERQWPIEIRSRLLGLIEGIPDGEIQPIVDPGAPDIDSWTRWVAAYEGLNWLDVPWFFAETYFYRRILAETGYFQTGTTHRIDPFELEKRRGLEQGLSGPRPSGVGEALESLLLVALWGNQADLSMWPTLGGDSGVQGPGQLALKHLLVDERPRAIAHLQSVPTDPRRIDLVLDNAGRELLADLALARGILSTYAECEVVLHAKAHPTFVSDAVHEDINFTLHEAGRSEGALGALADDLNVARQSGRMHVSADAYWTSPLAGWDMPKAARADLAESDLVIVKGDANYRRLVGDRHWPFSTPFESVLDYFPAPVLCLRTLKADVAVGLDPRKMQSAERADADWMIDGRWALIQFAEGQIARLP